MDGLDAALERARTAYADELEMMRLRQRVARKRNRLRKISCTSMVSGRAAEMLAELSWWGIPRPRTAAEAQHAKATVLARLELSRAGSPGYAEWRAAGFKLLEFWIETGKVVTATKVNHSRDGGDVKPSASVAFLAEQLPRVIPGLGKMAALDAAYTIAQAWRNEPGPHWSELVPYKLADPAGLAK